MTSAVYTGLFKQTGHPVVVIPLARAREGLPISVQVVGRLSDDKDLLAVAEQ